MPPKNSSDKSSYKNKRKLYLGKLKNGEVQATKIDLTKIKIKNISKENRFVKCRCKNVYVSVQPKEILCLK